MIRSRLRRAVALAVTLATLAVAGVAASPGAGASATNPGPGLTCTSGTDTCTGFGPSNIDPTCEEYQVGWTHDWYAVPGGEAKWHIQAWLWWKGGPSCTLYGGRHNAGQVLDAYEPDWLVPHVSVAYNQTYLELLPHAQSALYGAFGTSGTVAWTACIPTSGDADATFPHDSHSQPEYTYTAGSYSTDIWGQSGTGTPYANWCALARSGSGPYGNGDYGSDWHDGSWVGWWQYNRVGAWGTAITTRFMFR